MIKNRADNLGKFSRMGATPWNKGLVRTPKEKTNISSAIKKWHETHVHPKGMLGKKHTAKTRVKLSSVLNSPENRLRQKEGFIKYCQSQRISVVCKYCKKEFSVCRKRARRFVFCSYDCLGMSKRTPNKEIHDALRDTGRYKKWRTTVFERDNYTCQKCGKPGGILECHHKKSFSDLIAKNINLNLDLILKVKDFWLLENGTTLCHKCHSETDNYAGKIKKF